MMAQWFCWQTSAKYQEAKKFNRQLVYSGVLWRDLKSLIWKLLTSPVVEWTFCGVFFFFFARSFCPVSSLIQIICSISARRLQTFHPAKDQMCQTTDWHNLKKDMSMYELWVCGFSLLPNMDSKHVKTNKIDQLTLCAQTPQALQCENTFQFCLVCKRPQDKTKLKYLRRKCHSKATQWFWPLSYTHKDVFSPWRERKHFVRVCHLFLYKTRVLAQTHLK